MKSALQSFKDTYLAGCQPHLAECERRLGAVTDDPGATLTESCAVTLAAGGKRMRPLLVYLSTRRGAPVTDAQHAAAAAVELVHMATLVHDDVLDGADLRRGKPTVVSRYGESVSTAAGDFLFSSAFRILAAAGRPAAVSLLAQTSLDLSMGELMQMSQAWDYRLETAAYEERCRLKTAGLFSTSCGLGASLSGCSEATMEALDEFGRCLGLAFQVADDILDFGEADVTGKKAGADLRDGTVTLPLIIAMESDAGLREMMPGPGAAEDEIMEICDRVRRSGALEEAGRQAAAYVAMAQAAVEAAAGDLDPAPLKLIAEMAADRKV